MFTVIKGIDLLFNVGDELDDEGDVVKKSWRQRSSFHD